MSETTEKKQDRRVARTKRAIRNSFVKLLAEKDIEKITVKEIADGADVDRKTVYNYYSGVYDVLDELENELVQTFEKPMWEFEFNPAETQDIFRSLVKVLNENFELYELLMRIDSNSHLISKLVVYLRAKIRQVIERYEMIPSSKAEIAAEYVTSGIFSAYRYWFNSDRKQTLESFTEDVAIIVMEGLPKYFLKF